jgi:hypothetical protein
LASGNLRNGRAAAFHAHWRGGVTYGCFLSLFIVSSCFSFVSSIFRSTQFSCLEWNHIGEVSRRFPWDEDTWEVSVHLSFYILETVLTFRF